MGENHFMPGRIGRGDVGKQRRRDCRYDRSRLIDSLIWSC